MKSEDVKREDVKSEDVKLDWPMTSLFERNPTPGEISSACLYMDHSFGLMLPNDRIRFASEAAEWLYAWRKVQEDTKRHANRENENVKSEGPILYSERMKLAEFVDDLIQQHGAIHDTMNVISELHSLGALKRPGEDEGTPIVHHVTADGGQREHSWHERVKELVADLMELALDNRLDEGERSFPDSARRYCELRNEAVRLGLREGKLMDLGDAEH